MGRTVGRGVSSQKETVEGLKKDLETAQVAGEELIRKNKELEDKLKAAEQKVEEKEAENTELKQKIKELEDKLKVAEQKPSGKTTKPETENK